MRISDWSSDVCSSDLRPDRITPDQQLSAFHNSHRNQHFSGRLLSRSNLLDDPVRRRSERAELRGSGDDVLHKRYRTCVGRSEEHTSELQSLMRTSYAVFCLTNKNTLANFLSTTQALYLTT